MKCLLSCSRPGITFHCGVFIIYLWTVINRLNGTWMKSEALQEEQDLHNILSISDTISYFDHDQQNRKKFLWNSNERNSCSTSNLCGLLVSYLCSTNETGQWSGTDISSSVSTCAPTNIHKDSCVRSAVKLFLTGQAAVFLGYFLLCFCNILKRLLQLWHAKRNVHGTMNFLLSFQRILLNCFIFASRYSVHDHVLCPYGEKKLFGHEGDHLSDMINTIFAHTGLYRKQDLSIAFRLHWILSCFTYWGHIYTPLYPFHLLHPIYTLFSCHTPSIPSLLVVPRVVPPLYPVCLLDL